jgi:CHAT domain-containing protein/Tfp pilus assembly protein PilF
LIKAYVIGAISGLYAQRGEFNQALEYGEQSLTLHESVGDKAGIATALGSLGYLNGAAGNPDRAQDLLQRSLALSESIGDKADMAYALINLGARHFAQGDYTRALEYYERSLAINESVGNKSGIATGLNNIGIIYRIQGNYAQALEYLERSLKLHQQIGSSPGIARVLNSTGNVHRMQLDYNGARNSYEKSLTLYEQLGDKAGVATELDNIGSTLAAQRDYAGALKYLNRSLELTEANGLKAGLARSLDHAAFVYSAQGNYSAALQAADRATILGLEVGQIETTMDAHIAAGDAYLGLHQPDQARKAFDEAMTIIEATRSRVAGPEQEVQGFFEGHLYPYRAMVGLLITEGDIPGALSYAERGKARVLLDVLSTGRANVSKAMTAEEQEHERRLAAELAFLNNQVYAEQQRAQPDTGRIAALNEQVRKARLDHEDFQTTLYALHPELKVKRGEAGPLNLDEATSLVSDGRTALLEYVVTNDKTYLFALTRSHEPSSHPINLTVHTIDSGEAALARQVEQFRQTLANQNYGFQKSAVDLWRLLLGPVQSQIAGQSSVVIVPDSILWNLPFQALLSAEGRFLIEDCAVSYAPSLTVLNQMQPNRKNTAPYAGELLAVGNPLPNNLPPARANSALIDQRFDSLPEAEAQARALGKLYGAQRSKVLVGADAREDVIKAEASNYRVLQFATHGVFNDASPMYSYILLSKANTNTTEDGFLEAWELMNLNLNADLVVLSACETARGRVGAGEGVIGLSWALFVAGCPSLVLSQWKVESASTTELMLEFHRNLAPGAGLTESGSLDAAGRLSGRLSKSEALRRAQLGLLHSKKYSHPFYWAGFVLMGDGSRPLPQ